jgi:hypothetical protein
MQKFKAQVQTKSPSQAGTPHAQWVEIEAKNAYDATTALNAMYGRILSGPIAVTNKGGGSYYDRW